MKLQYLFLELDTDEIQHAARLRFDICNGILVSDLEDLVRITALPVIHELHVLQVVVPQRGEVVRPTLVVIERQSEDGDTVVHRVTLAVQELRLRKHGCYRTQEIEVHRLLGGLAPDTDIHMPDNMQQQIKSNWRRIEDTITDVKFNFDFWTKNIPRRSTYPACRAVITARQQGEEYDIEMTKAIQRAYYQEARNPSDNLTLINIATNIGLSVLEFEKDLNSKRTQDDLMKEILLSRELYAESFPNLVLKMGGELFTIPIDYNNSKIMQDSINSKLKAA